MRKSKEEIMLTEYSTRFDVLRQKAIEMSYYKYGPSRTNFTQGYVDAIGSLEKCLQRFKETGNTEYLVDIANYAMFRFMYPQNGERYQATDSEGSAGIAGMGVAEIERWKEDHGDC